MCLVALAWQAHPAWPLIVAANRDEFHRRPAEPLHWWPDRPEVAGGRDLAAGGTWLAATRDGRFATVTNYRESLETQPGARSRGTLVTDFLGSGRAPLAFTQDVAGPQYAGFSLLAGTPDAIAYVSNRGDPARPLAPGVYGLSNASLDTPWPKVIRSRRRLQSLLDRDAVTPEGLLGLLADRETADEHGAPARDLPPAEARAVSAPFVVTPEFGTRCSTVLLLDADGEMAIHERRFDASGEGTGDSSIRFRLEQAR